MINNNIIFSLTVLYVHLNIYSSYGYTTLQPCSMIFDKNIDILYFTEKIVLRSEIITYSSPFVLLQQQPFMALWILSRTTWVNWYQKGKTSLDLLEQEIVSVSGISWAICKSAPHPRHNHTSIPPLCFYRPDALPGCPTNSVKALKAFCILRII